MANCIDIVKPKSLTFTPNMFDIERYQKFLTECEEKINWDNSVKDSGGEHGMWLRIAWWFLSKNTTIHYDEKEKPVSCVINLGQGRSTHTTRDIKVVFAVLYSFMVNKDQKNKLIFRDDGYGPSKTFLMTFPDCIINKIPTL